MFPELRRLQQGHHGELAERETELSVVSPDFPQMYWNSVAKSSGVAQCLGSTISSAVSLDSEIRLVLYTTSYQSSLTAILNVMPLGCQWF